MEKHLHIVCLNVPYPVDYGGVFDLYNKLPALHNQGIKIHLHCFEYGRGAQPKLEEYCASVHYYPRLMGMEGWSFRLPFIVSSRRSKDLVENLLADDHPILMEGIHCTYLLNDPRFAKRRCFVRLHNVEFIYYRHLFLTSPFSLKKLYYGWESRLLFAYEKKICNRAVYLPVSQSDADLYKQLGCTQVQFMPLFLPEWPVSALAGRGSYCLYQGDLSVHENQKAAKWLLTEVFNDIDIPLVIAGKNPPQWLARLVYQNSNACLVANPKETEMQDMIAKAHIHVIPSFNATGIKLKLVNALYNGRHAVVNAATVMGTGLGELCHVADDAADFKAIIRQMFELPFADDQLQTRRKVLELMFNNEHNATSLINLIYS